MAAAVPPPTAPASPSSRRGSKRRSRQTDALRVTFEPAVAADGQTVTTTAKLELFRPGFGPFLQSGFLSDLTLITESNTYKVHRLILAHSSEFFNRLLLSNFRESTASTIELKFPDPAGVFGEVLKFLYTGEIGLTIENAIPLETMADHYFIHSLKKRCNQFIKSTINRSNAVAFLRQAIKCYSEENIERCLLVIAKNFCHTVNGADYSFMPKEIFIRLLQHPNLAVTAEYPLYRVICSYIERCGGASVFQPDEIAAMMKTVRFRWMPFDKLLEAQANPLVPQQLIVDALLRRLHTYEHGTERLTTVSNEVPLALRPRQANGITFEYSGVDFDTQGILYWIATNSLQEEWKNPCLAGRVGVAASSIEKGDLSTLVDRESAELWTMDVPASWFLLDLGPTRGVVPTYYTLRHGGNYKADSLRTWDFQGSVDGTTWVLLRRHVNDPSLGSNFASATWPLPPQEPAVPFRMFRVLQTGHNSSNHNFLALSGIELYGDYFEFSTEHVQFTPPPRTAGSSGASSTTAAGGTSKRVGPFGSTPKTASATPGGSNSAAESSTLPKS